MRRNLRGSPLGACTQNLPGNGRHEVGKRLDTSAIECSSGREALHGLIGISTPNPALPP